MMYTGNQVGQRTVVNPFRQALIGSEVEVGTSDILGAYGEEGLVGSYTGAATARTIGIKTSEAFDKPITEEEYKNSPSFRSGINYYKGMTNKSAEILAQNSDAEGKRAFIISKANTAQDVAGVVTTLGAGIVEPQNVAIGLATAGVGELVGVAINAKKIFNLYQKLGKYQKLAVKGGVEGLAAAAAQEPLNRYTAKTLQQDYTMTDSVFNFATSVFFGAGFRAGMPYTKEVALPYLNNKIQSRKMNPTQAIHDSMDELDVATKQVLLGQEIDVDHVRAVKDGDITRKPVDQKALIAEEFVRYTETPEFKAKFGNSKALTPEGKPIMGYHGTGGEFGIFSTEGIGKSKGAGSFFSSDPQIAGTYAPKDGGNVRPAYFRIENPFIVDMEGQNWSKIDGKTTTIVNGKSARLDSYINEFSVTSDKLSRWAKDNGYDGVIYKNASDRGPYYSESGITQTSDVYNVFNPDQIISAFGADDLDNITARINKQNTEVVRRTALKSTDPANSTAYDAQGIKEVEEFAIKYPDEKTQELLTQYEEEISAMKDQGLLSEEDLSALEYLNTIREEDVMAAYESLYVCLTRG